MNKVTDEATEEKMEACTLMSHCLKSVNLGLVPDVGKMSSTRPDVVLYSRLTLPTARFLSITSLELRKRQESASTAAKCWKWVTMSS